MKCPYCGKEVLSGYKFCDGCGAKLTNDETKEEEVVYYQPPRKSKTGLIVAIVIISVLLIAGIIVGIVLLNNGGGNKEKEKENYNTKKEETVSKVTIDKVKYSDVVVENGDIILFVKNNNSSEVFLDFKIEFYDENNVEIDRQYGSLKGLPEGEETILRIFGSSKKYDNYKIKVETTTSSYYKSNMKDVKITSKDNKENQEIEVVFTNNSKNDLENATVAAIFYKDGKAVGYASASNYDVTAGKSVALYIYYPYDNNYNKIEFDDYKVYLVEASSYKF